MKRSGSKQELLSKRPRSSSHSVFDAAKDNGNAKGTKTLADREQDPDAAVFLALLRDVSKQLDENARKKQRVAAEKVKEREQMQSKGGQGGDQRSTILQHSSAVPKQDKGKGKEDASVIQSASNPSTPYDVLFNDSTSTSNSMLDAFSQPTVSTGSKASNLWPNIDISQRHSGQSIITETTSRSRNLTRVSSMDPNVPSRQAPITDSRDLTRTPSSSTISLDPYRAETAPLVVDLTLDDVQLAGIQGSLQGVGKNTSREHGTHAAASADESFMAVESDISFGRSTDTDVDMDISIHRKALSRSGADIAILPSTTQQQLSTGQGRPIPPHRPQLGMRRPAVLSSNIQRNSPHPHPSQYSISSHVPKGTTVPRFKPPLLSTPAAQKASAQKVSAESTFTRPRVGGVASGVGRDTQDVSRRQEGHARRQREMPRSSSETDPDSSFDISFDLDMDVLEEAMRPYD